MAEEFAVCRLPPEAVLPAWADAPPFSSATRTPDELSVVCPAAGVPTGVRTERGWALLTLQGPFPFDAVGVLRALLDPLAAAGVGILTVSTFDTDYVLVKQSQLPRALRALAAAGHRAIVR
jgi:hypothetical protein